MRVLALEPYYAGSHRAFLDGWAAAGRHDWTVLSLPGHHWKWRMRHAAATFARQLTERVDAARRWDCIVCSDMLNLPEFLGLAPGPLRNLPAVVYFHENQLTYPVRVRDPRDLHFSLTNLMTALAAGEVWFNSAYHRDTLLPAFEKMLRKIPDGMGFDAVAEIRAKSRVRPPGIDPPADRPARRPGPLRVLWAARWEHDKGPGAFFRAVDLLADDGVEFRLSVIGEQFRDTPPVFAEASQRHARRIDRWGFLSTREDYRAALGEADVFVSTAEHEFFGLSAVEAVAAGAYPLLPRRLAYPDVLRLEEFPRRDAFFYEGDAGVLAGRLAALAERVERGELWRDVAPLGPGAVAHLLWPQRARARDDALQNAARR